LGIGCGVFYQGAIRTKKHFEAIAEILREHNDKASIINALAFEFAKFNPNFDAERFVKACLNSK
jgi:hypothetical protein